VHLIGIPNLYMSMYYPQTNVQVKRFNKTLVDMLMHYIRDQQDSWDELVSMLALAYKSRPHRTAGVALMELVTQRRLSLFSLERMPDGMTSDPSRSVSVAKDAFLETLQALLLRERDSISNLKHGKRKNLKRTSARAECRCPVVTGCTCATTPGSTSSPRR